MPEPSRYQQALRALTSLSWSLHSHPLSIGPGAVFKLSLWPSVSWAAVLEECCSSLVLVIPTLGHWAPWFGPWPSDFTTDYCRAVDLPGNSWNGSWCVWADSAPLYQSSIISELVLWCGLLVGCGGCLWRGPAHLAQVLWGCALAALFCSAPTLPFLMARDAAHLCSLSLAFSVSSHYAVVINIY